MSNPTPLYDPSSAYVPAVVYSDRAAPDFLYEPPPGADLDHGPATDPDAAPLMLRNAGRNLTALTGLFFVNLAAFIVCVTLFSLGAGLLVIVVGLFVLVGCLGAAGCAGAGEQERAGVRRGRPAGDALPAHRRGIRRAATAAGSAVVAGPDPRPHRVRAQHLLVLGGGELGVRRHRWRPVLVLGRLPARRQPGARVPARFPESVRRVRRQRGARRDHAPDRPGGAARSGPAARRGRPRSARRRELRPPSPGERADHQSQRSRRRGGAHPAAAGA